MVLGARASVATRWALSSDTVVPVGLTQGAAQLRVKLAAPAMGAIGSLKTAAMMGFWRATPVALFTGTTAVTVGGSGGSTGGTAATVVNCQL